MDIGGLFLVCSWYFVGLEGCRLLRYVMFSESTMLLVFGSGQSSESPEETCVRSGSCTGNKKTFTLQLTPQSDHCVFTQAVTASVLKNTTQCPLR
jgi:hypothetical protein